MTAEIGHATISSDGSDFTSLTELYPTEFFKPLALAALAAAMANSPDDLSDGPDPEENRYMPAGYTYLGQFIDHDLTLDTASSLQPNKANIQPNNLRTPRLDLDCVYSHGPDDQPYMYMQEDREFVPDPDHALPLETGYLLYKGASLLPGGAYDQDYTFQPHGTDKSHDLVRSPDGRAIIGDKRNDENSIVNQIQQLFIAFHNRVVETLVERHPALADDRGALFETARTQVRWAYQSIVLKDYLKRIIRAQEVDEFDQDFRAYGGRAFKLYKRPDEDLPRDRLPREFSVAAYRFGHSAVRLGYRMNRSTALTIFPNPNGIAKLDGPMPKADAKSSLVGFEPLDTSHVVEDWNRFFPTDELPPGEISAPDASDASKVTPATVPSDPQTAIRLQFAYKLDPSLVEPLITLPPAISGRDDLPPDLQPKNRNLGPSLALLNLLRGNRYRIASAQKLLRAAHCQGLSLPGLDPSYLCVRVVTKEDDAGKHYTFVPINRLPVDPPPQPGEELDVAALPAGPVAPGQPPKAVMDVQDLEVDTPLWFYVLAEAQKPIIDYWLDRGGKLEDRATDLSEDMLKGLVPPRSPGVPLPSGSQLTGLGVRILLEVFYGILQDDPNSVLASPPPGGRLVWDEVSGDLKPATMATLIRFTAQPGKTFAGETLK